ncbi:hypothetical protein [Streptomyces sp. ISL-100]|uniref:hypothetical protein n=1 Tax=Streptomyces sp. ISL-100 TaxID=2819173 RepID=UPI001BEB59F8|nr:hypothetical protein [Streptomyces sp. ISL-100]MBT2396371.1 hypothetical protein [Streptomyces sp. ISL-100]
MGQIGQVLYRWRWIWALAIIAAACCLATTLVFAPGYLSYDSLFQLEQATGTEPLSDWHPPIMSLVWRALIAATGTLASMAVLQAVILWGALWVIACVVHEATASRSGALAILGLGLLPYVLTFVGVVWKDVHMAFALLATTAIALTGLRLGPGRPGLRWALFALGALFMIYAILVRKNAVFAAIPVFVMLVLALWPRPGRRTWTITTAALLLGLVASTATISLAARPVKTHQISQIMLDDLLHVLDVDELQSAAVTPDLRDRLVAGAKECKRVNSLSDSYWSCYGRGEHGAFTAVAHPEEITSLWLSEMTSHVPGYLQYRLQLFSEFLFEPRYQYHPGISPNDQGLQLSHPGLGKALQTYVDGAARDLPVLFAGSFWLTIAIILSVRPGSGTFAMPVRALGISAAVYVLGYLPVLPVTNYRYMYWSAIACTLGLLLCRLRRGRSGTRTAPTSADPSRQPPSRATRGLRLQGRIHQRPAGCRPRRTRRQPKSRDR